MPDKKDPKKDGGKQTIKIRPVEYSLFCDYASVSMDGKLNLMGIFERILTENVPANHPQMSIITKLVLPKGDHKITFTLMQQDKVLAKADMEKTVEQEIITHTHFWNVRGLQIETWEPVEMHILIGGKQVMVRRLPVVKVEQKKA